MKTKPNYEAQENIRLLIATLTGGAEVFVDKRKDKVAMKKWAEDIDAMLVRNPVCYGKSFVADWKRIKAEFAGAWS